MPDTTNEDLIASLLDYLDGRLSTDHRWTDAIRGLVAERDKLVEDNASQTYKGNSVRYWHDKASAYKATIFSLWEILESAAVCPDGERTITAFLTALVAERDALRERVSELEARAKPVYITDGQRVESIDLRERLVCAALTGLNSNPDFTENADVLPRWAINQADQVLAAMRKGDSDGK